jgi:hypothetical protein
MAAQDPAEVSASAQPTPEQVAQLAISFLPPLVLPVGWDTMDPQILK